MTNASELLEGTTPGPWELRGPTLIYGNLQRDMNQTGDKVASMVSANDARLCVAAPDLARQVTQLEAQLAEVREGLARFVRARDDYLEAGDDTIAGMQWQPIETAPRDGTRILIAMPRDEAPVCEAWWAQDYENGPGYWSTPPSCTGRGYTILPTYPTHWMPLPNPPALKGGDHGIAAMGEVDDRHLSSW